MVDYTNYDYDALVQRLTDLVKDQEGWGDGYNSSMGQTIIQNVSFIVDQLHYMLERRSMENFMPTARLSSSVKSLAHAHGYRPRRKVSATGLVTIQLQDEDGNEVQAEGDVIIDRYTPVFFNDIQFLTNEQVVIEAGESSATFEIIEGEFEQTTVDPDDEDTFLNESNYILLEDFESIEENSLEVESENDTYLDVTADRESLPPIEAISFADPDDPVYDLRIFNDGMGVIFGNNTFGKKPDTSVTVSWINSRGSEVDIQSTGLEFELEDDSLTDDLNTDPENTYNYVITNDEAITGGLDEESIQEVRLRSPEFIRTANRAITKEDFEFWAKRSGIGGIIDSFVYGEEELGITVFNMNNVYLTYLTTTGEELTTSDEQDFRDFMNELMPITTHLVLDAAEEIPLEVELRVQRDPKLEISNAELYAVIREELEDYFAIEEDTLKKDFFHSRLNSHLHNLTITRNGQTIRLFDYVYLNINPTKRFSIPRDETLYFTDQQYNIQVVAGSDGDEYQLILEYSNSQNETKSAIINYTQESGDSSTDIVTALANDIDALDGLTGTADGDELQIDTEDTSRDFGITNKGTTVPENIPVESRVVLPPRLFDNEDDIELFKRDSIEIMKDEYPFDVIGEDDGNGTLTFTTTGETGSIDYVTGEMILPLYSKEDYLIRYQQDNDEENVFTSPISYVGIYLPKENINDSDNSVSTIEIL